MTELVYPDAAERDLTRIALYFAADDPRAARGFVERVRDRCAHLVHFPDLGRRRSDIGPDIRALVHGSYVIYYQRMRDFDRVHNLRVCHGRRKTPTMADLL